MDSEDSDNIYNDTDRHDAALDEILDYSDDDEHEEFVPERRYEQVLRVDSTSSDDDNGNDDDDNADDDFYLDSDDSEQADGAKLESSLPSSNRWGKGRKTFYNTSYVDGDWGGMNEQELELAELEEIDAVERQRKLDAALSHVPFDMQQPFDMPVVSALSLKWTDDDSEQGSSNVYTDLRKMMDEYEQKRSYLVDQLNPLMDTIFKNFSENVILKRQICLVVGIYSRYLMNILFYLHYAKTANSSKDHRKNCLDHPVLDALIDLKYKIAKAEIFMQKYSKLFESLRGSNHCDFEVISKEYEPSSGETEPIHIDNHQNSEDALIDQGGFEDYDDDHSTEKRGITSQIGKNKGLAQKRKKGTQHSRVKKRKQFRSATQKRNSQIPKMRNQSSVYGGESRGIRISTVKSIKLKA